MTGTQRRLLEAAQQGDQAAIEQLLRCYERLIWRVVWSGICYSRVPIQQQLRSND